MNFEVDAQEVIKELLEINKDLNLQLALIKVMYNQEKLKNKIDVDDDFK
jgi:hypothetical protein